MLKFSLWRKMTVILLALVVSACGGAGSSAPAPTGGITVTPGNGQVFVTWTATPGVDYWLMFAQTSSPIDMKNPPINHLWAPSTQMTSPYVLTGLTNGLPYSFAMNGRNGGGVGGPQTPSVSATPRPAGANWITGSGIAGTANMRGITLGTSTTDSLNYFLAVGDGGVMYKDLENVAQSLPGAGYVWSPVTPTTALTTDFRAATYAFSKYIAIGANNGTSNIVSSPDLTTWTAATWTPAGANLNAMANSGSALVAVGDAGVVFYTTDGTTWTAAASTGTTANLYGVTYSSSSGVWVAVGAGGTLITSTDASHWTAGTSNTSADLKSITATVGNYLVAVGTSGTIITNLNTGTWTSQTLTSNPTLNAVSTDSVQFLAVGASGVAYISLDGATWTPVTNMVTPPSTGTGTTKDLYAIFGSASKYLVVGQSGTTISSIN